MITEKQIEIIRKYVPEEFFSQEKLIKYLSLHEMVGVEVFEYVAKRVYRDSSSMREFDTVVPIVFRGDWKDTVKSGEEGDSVDGVKFEPEDVETFIRRVPFNFYHKYSLSDCKDKGIWFPVEINSLLYCVGDDPFSVLYYHRKNPLALEDAYCKLEYLFYDKGYSLYEIFSYPETITWTSESELFADWFDYIDMCIELGWEELMPANFYYMYNTAREALGIPPIIFHIQEYDTEAWKRDRDEVKFYKRKGNTLEFYGVFPCDEDNIPVLRWIGIDIKDAESILCTSHNELESFMTVKLTPETVVKAQIVDRDEIGNELEGVEPKWVQIYAGPQTMVFDYSVLKERRTTLGYTQQQVADAVQANIRTYQKWENGETTPDGFYLLRLMNWLDISSVDNIIIYSIL
jgi:hypothetical protein